MLNPPRVDCYATGNPGNWKEKIEDERIEEVVEEMLNTYWRQRL
ncbi:MAG: hypothetical protein RSA71_04040 [Eubacterium sp.]